MAEAKKKKPTKEQEEPVEEESLSKTQIEKLNNDQVEKLKGKLVEVRRAGASPIFVEVARNDTISDCLVKADVPTDDEEIKVEAMEDGKNKWEAATLSDKAIKFKKIVVTTKVRGSI